MHPYDCSEIYGNADHYDGQNSSLTQDIDFYCREAIAAGGPILECACGTGRVTIPLARTGLPVTGLEYSLPMLEGARAKAEAENLSIEWVRGDMRTWSGGRRFKFVCIPFNAFLHLYDRESAEAFLSRCRDHLLPGGRFAFNIFVPDPCFLIDDDQKRYKDTLRYPDPMGNGEVRIDESNYYDPATQINHVSWYVCHENGQEEKQALNMRIYWPQEIDALLHYNGWRVIYKYGDFDATPFGPTSRHQVFVCEVA